MNDVAGRVGLTGAELARYNGLSPSYLPRSGEVLALPKGTVIPVEASEISQTGATTNSLESIAQTAIGRAGDTKPKVAVQNGPEPIRHVVEPGETIYSIARLYRVSVPSLASWNGLGKDLAVREGQRLLIPVVGDGSVKSQDNDFQVTEPAPGAGSITPIPPSAVEPLPDKVVESVVPESPNLVETRTPCRGVAQIVDSAKEPPLSSIALEWMLDGAKGLKLKRGVKFSTTPSNPLYPLDRLTKKCKLFTKWWEGPMSDWELYPSTRKHVNALATYRPKSLHKIF